jgi:hypothetical protein
VKTQNQQKERMSFFFPFPAIDLNPSIDKVFANFGDSEIKTITGNALLGGGAGYFFHFIKPNSKEALFSDFNFKGHAYLERFYHIWGSGLGAFVGAVTCHFRVTNQLQGYLPNDHLTKKYPPLTDQQIIEQFKKENITYMEQRAKKEKENPKRYPMVHLNPSSKEIVSNFDKMDYGRMALTGFIFFSGGYLVHSKHFPSLFSLKQFPILFYFYFYLQNSFEPKALVIQYPKRRCSVCFSFTVFWKVLFSNIRKVSVNWLEWMRTKEKSRNMGS